jgi:hypothetical protein
MKKIICFDLDKVICKNFLYKNKKIINYNKSIPITKSVKLINKLFEEGYQIDVFTSRGMTRYNGDMNKIIINLKKKTIHQLTKWKLKYNNLYFGKPYYDYFVDDKAYGFKKNWHKDFKKYLNK